MRDIAILGAGGQARETAFLIEEINRCDAQWRIIGFVDNDHTTVGRAVGKYSVAYAEDEIRNVDCALVVGIGDPHVLTGILRRFEDQLEARFPNLTHPSVTMDPTGVRLGHGNVICAGSVLTTDIELGSLNIVGVQCAIGHDAVIGSGCVMNPSATISGNVTVGDGCLIGASAQILQGLSVADGATIGAGAVVTKDVEPGSTVVGVPAKPSAPE